MVELRCQGKTTELLSSESSIEQQATDLENILQALEIERCNLVGFSFGGRVAIAMAAHKPQYVGEYLERIT